MKKIKIFDTTLRDGEQAPGNSMHASEKLEVSAQLERLGVDIIEAGFAASSNGDFRSVKEIADAREKSIVCSLSRCVKGDIDLAYGALKTALVTPRLHLFLATSPIHMEYKLKMAPDKVLAKIAESVSYAKQFFSDIQFSCEDASRSERAFLVKAVQTAVDSGATTINIPDTTGYSYPQEMKELLEYLLNNVKGSEKITFAVHCHNDLGLAVANTLAAIEGGATQAECTVNGIGERAGNAALEEIAVALKTRKDHFQADTNIVTKQIYQSSYLLSSITGVKIHPTKPLVGKNAFAHESGIHQAGVLANRLTYEIIKSEDLGITIDNIVLGKHSGRHAFKDYLDRMGIAFEESELNVLFERFKDLADKKKDVSHKDIEQLVTVTNISKVKKRVTLHSYGITSKGGHAVAEISLDTEDGVLNGKSEGDGPLDAAFKAINALLKKEFVLLDWSANAITGGEDAMGAATLRLSLNGVEVTGRGLSTDTVEASILAYLNGCNKILDTL